MTTTDGIYVRGHLIAEGDMSGPYSAQVVLRDPLVDCAVLETARGGILRSGLGYKTADVGVVLNVQPDHLGLQNIRDLDELAKVKAVVAEAVREGGTTVLNADDPMCVDMTQYCREHVVFFSLRSTNPVVLDHVDRGHTAVVCEQGYIAVLESDHLIAGGARGGHPDHARWPRRVQRPERARGHRRGLRPRHRRGRDPPRAPLVPAVAAADARDAST